MSSVSTPPNSLPNTPPSISSEEISRVIGLIYDCAIDPELWPVALEAMGQLIGARMSSIAIFDPSQKSARYAYYWGADPDWPYWIKLFEEKYAALMPFYGVMEALPVDQVINTAMMIEASGVNDFYEGEFYKGWGEPAGLKDVAAAVVVRSSRLNVGLNIHTPLTADYVGRREIEIVELLLPHVRRAALIGDLLDMQVLEAASVKSTLDLLSTAVILTDGEAKVVHANAAGKAMLAAADPISIEFEKLTVRDKDATQALRAAIARAAKDEAGMGGTGIGVPVPFADGRPAIAHVLPLATPPLRSQLAPSVKAAVFISTTDAAMPPVEAMSALFELTAAEQKVLRSVLDGRNQSETAEHLKIAESTVKTHLGRIFSKSHTTNQSELAKLAERLAGRTLVQN